MIEFEKQHILIAKYSRNLETHCIVKIFLILHSVYIIPKNQEKIVFYVNNNIDWHQFNQSYVSNWLKNGIKNADAVAWKFKLALTKTINLKNKKARKNQEVVDRQKLEAITKK